MKKRIQQQLIVLAVLLFPVSQARAQNPTIVKLATIAPKGTSPHQALLRMAEKWRLASGEQVRVTIYTDGTQGGEAESIRRIRVKQLQATLVTVTGLSEIEPSASALQNLPFTFRSLDEVEYVQQKLTPEMERRFSDKGFVVLFWGDLGWVRYFSNERLVHPADMRTMKVFTWAGDPYQADIMKAAGYNPVPLETHDIFTGLQTGLINALPVPPMFALTGQLDTKAKHMLDINYAPLVGGLVIDKKTWEGFTQNWQAAFRMTAQEAGDEIRKRGRLVSASAVAAMQKRGLQVEPGTPDLVAEWQKLGEQFYPKIRGTIVPAEMFDRVQALLKEYRFSVGKN